MRSLQLTILVCILLVGAGVVQRWVRNTRADEANVFTALRAPLTSLPEEVGPWRLYRELPLQPDVLQTARVDSFIHREYHNSRTGRPALFYVGYWGRENEGMGHGPEVCYPAVGWAAEGQPVEVRLAADGADDAPGIGLSLSRFQRTGPAGVERQVVAFTAVISGEFAATSRGRFWHLPGRLHRTGGHYLAHVQVATRVAGSLDSDWQEVEREVLTFLELVIPSLKECFAGPPDNVVLAGQ